MNGTNNNNSGNYKIIDKQTKSEWNFEGRAINGQLKGKQLVRLPFDEGFWFEWVAFHPKTGLYTGQELEYFGIFNRCLKSYHLIPLPDIV